MSDETQLAALNYVKFVYGTGTERGTLSDAIANDDDDTWQSVVALAARATKRRTATYVFTADDLKNAARIANSWILAAQNGTGFFFAKVNNAEQKVAPVLVLRDDGEVVSAASKTTLAGAAADVPAGTDDPASVAKFGDPKVWSLGVTDAKNLVFRKDGAPQFTITSDGKVWSAGVKGTLTVDETKPDVPVPELRTMWPPVPAQASYAGWTIGTSYTGYLAFRNNGDVKALITPEGRLWIASGAGFVAPAAQAIVPGSIPSGNALAVIAGGAVVLGTQGYNLARDGVMTAVNWITGAADGVSDWTVGAADTAADWSAGAANDTAAWFTGASGSVADGFDVAVDWTGTAITDATDWIKDAGNTVYGGLRYLDPTSW